MTLYTSRGRYQPTGLVVDFSKTTGAPAIRIDGNTIHVGEQRYTWENQILTPHNFKPIEE